MYFSPENKVLTRGLKANRTTHSFLELFSTVDSIYLDYPLSRISLYLEVMPRSLYGHSNLFSFLYLELSLCRSFSLVPCKVEIVSQCFFSRKIAYTSAEQKQNFCKHKQIFKNQSNKKRLPSKN